MQSEFNNSEGVVTKDKLVQDLRTLVRDAEDLVKSTAGTVAERSKDELKVALDRLRASTKRLEEKAAGGMEATDALIREHPYHTLGVAFGVGLLIGVLVHRR